ncbi:fas apoptotic inhibitory molecule 3-like [Cyprinodon tularosa]|uniref:fas apoptotic inhibitory molecule 3-like n=1 Tax=Cyprinodon tularosa TaxID=77115 RepID=UPI0018E26466|nr:fas apoptotic inhibitory molecule 3-like [Cyprinodon tularosa]
MKVCSTLICILFLTALQDGETVETYRGKEGGSITVRCEFKNSGSRRFLCKETCKGGNILINTTEDMFTKNRYSIRYEERGKLQYDYLHVSITKLKKSDSGRYWCLSDTWRGTQYDDFILSVTEDSSEPKWTLGPFIRSTFLPAASTTTTTTQSLSSSPSPSSSETSRVSEKPAAASGLLLYVLLSLVAKIILFSTPLVIFCRKRRLTESKGPAVETEFSEISQTNP